MKALAMSICKAIFGSPDRVRGREVQSGARNVATVWGLTITRGARLSNGRLVVIERHHVIFETGSAGMIRETPCFEIGDRVRVWDERAQKWKITSVRAKIWEPYQRSDDPAFYQVDDDGKLDPREYRAEELQPLADSCTSTGGEAVRTLPRA